MIVLKIFAALVAVSMAIAFAFGLAWRELAELAMRRLLRKHALDTLGEIFAAGLRPLTNDRRIALLSALWDAEVLPGLMVDLLEAKRRKFEALRVPFPATTPEMSVPQREEPPAPEPPRVNAPRGTYVQFGDLSGREH